jgi:hypothetical protein
MTTTDARVDAYIARAPGFATGILTQLRALVHEACPEVVETIKWGMPFFAHHGPLCFVAAFTKHCAFGFWRHRGSGASGAMGHYGRMASVTELPPRRELIAAIHAAMARNQSRAQLRSAARGRMGRHSGGTGPRSRPARARKGTGAPAAPADLGQALAADRDARREFAAFSPGKQREYIAWLEEAKRPETRAKRLATAISWIAEGKERNWKYRR